MEPQELHFKDDGKIPNNPKLSVLLYKGAFKGKEKKIEKTFNAHHWMNSWQGSVFDYHHYHSNAHEVLGVRSGSATVVIGGEAGEELTVEEGDVIVLPAGTGHKKVEATEDFQVIGAYPGGVTPNKKTGKPDERPHVLEDIAVVPMPKCDPVFGERGPLTEKWI